MIYGFYSKGSYDNVFEAEDSGALYVVGNFIDTFVGNSDEALRLVTQIAITVADCFGYKDELVVVCRCNANLLWKEVTTNV